MSKQLGKLLVEKGYKDWKVKEDDELTIRKPKKLYNNTRFAILKDKRTRKYVKISERVLYAFLLAGQDEDVVSKFSIGYVVREKETDVNKFFAREVDWVSKWVRVKDLRELIMSGEIETIEDIYLLAVWIYTFGLTITGVSFPSGKTKTFKVRKWKYILG